MSDLNTIWISSPPRTGSMWVFNITREIYRYLGFNVKPKSIPQNDSEMFDIYKSQALNEKDNGTKYVLKVHTILKPNLPKSKVITTLRDPRDLCISFKEFMKSDFKSSLKAATTVKSFSNIYKNFKDSYILTIKFENIEKNSTNQILNIAKFLNEELNIKQAEQISEKFSKNKVLNIINKNNKEMNDNLKKNLKIDEKKVVIISKENIRSFDTNTGFQTGHISARKSGEWRNYFSKNEIKILNDEFKFWLKEFDYEL